MQPSWIGQTLGGRYRLDALLGQGGMSAVYRATDPNLKRTVAVKLIHSHLSSNAEFVRRFEQEAEAVAQLRHPNIIQVYDFAHDGDVYYMVLEYLPGETLQHRLADLASRGERLSLRDAASIMAKVCEAVAYAHQRGMVHRDLKPANVMLNPQGEPTLMDFGVARMLGAASQTATGTLIGTAYYMSPEQVQGKHPDGRADIYSLGVMLFEILAGRRPFEGDSATAIMMKHLSEPVPDLRQLNLALPADLINIVNRALAKDPTQRYQTADEMARALRAADLRPAPYATAGTVLEAPPPPPPTTVQPAQAWQPQPPPRPAGSAPPGLAGVVAQPQPAAQRSRLPLVIGAGVGGVLLLVCLVVGAVLAYQTFGGGAAAPATATLAPTQVLAELPTLTTVPQLTEAPTTQPSPTPTAAPIEATLPTEPPTPTETPAPTEPTGPYVRIDSITIEGNRYIVNYETFGYTEKLPGMHVHFFFNTVPPEQAGVPNAGPWFVWGGPRPFNGYTLADKPAAATQMCALVANPDHSVIQGTGNCVDLPG